ncbi:MAG: hypothetical protein ABIC04_08175 [Nanoarchaeota archaeon]
MNMGTLHTLQTVCNIIIVVGIFATGLAGFGNYYFGKKITELKDQKSIEEEKNLNTKIETLLKGNEKLKSELAPFKKIAEEKFPNESIQAALNKLSEELHNINQKTAKTVFKIERANKQQLPSGEFETKIQLKPMGTNVIPL